eukprot:scaffold8400_cov69-Phaeocystis_antarctica.AAC.1
MLFFVKKKNRASGAQVAKRNGELGDITTKFEVVGARDQGHFKFNITWQDDAGCTQRTAYNAQLHDPLAQLNYRASCRYTAPVLARGPLVQKAPVVAVALRGAGEAHPWVALP